MKFDPSKLKKASEVSESGGEYDNMFAESEDDTSIQLNGYVPKTTVIEAGLHPVMIQDIEENMSKAGNKYLRLWFEVVAGPDSGSRFSEICSVFHPKPGVQNRAKSFLSSYMDASGIAKDERNFKTFEEMLAKFKSANPVKGKVGVKDDDDFGSKNYVIDFNELTSEFLASYDSSYDEKKNKEDIGACLDIDIQ